MFWGADFGILSQSTFPDGVVSNAHVAAAVDEHTGKITFLYSIRPGPTTQSYGMNVARLAGEGGPFLCVDSNLEFRAIRFP